MFLLLWISVRDVHSTASDGRLCTSPMVDFVMKLAAAAVAAVEFEA